MPLRVSLSRLEQVLARLCPTRPNHATLGFGCAPLAGERMFQEGMFPDVLGLG